MDHKFYRNNRCYSNLFVYLLCIFVTKHFRLRKILQQANKLKT
jgi:hypothetical protein